MGAYYYPWWGAIQGGHTLQQAVRSQLTPAPQPPAVGSEYSSRDASVIASHIDQSHLGNISMWSMSWWGPNSFEDRTIRNHILPHPRAAELSYTIHYESSGRLRRNNATDYTNLIPDFRHLAENVFSDPNYMRIDDRPVVVMYLSRVFFKDDAGATALQGLRSTMASEYGFDPYIIGDHVFNGVADGAANLDAITGFDVYGQVFGDGVVSERRIEKLNRIYSSAKAEADAAGVAFVPGVAPGYNDRAVRDGNLPAARYLPDQGFGSAMEAMLQEAVLPNTDAGIDELILVNSFNEWHEDTQIEATVVADATSTDSSPSGTELTSGRSYEGYGTLYLDILRNATVSAQSATGDFNLDGVVNLADYTLWRDTLGQTGSSLAADADGNQTVGAPDYEFWKSRYGNSTSLAGSSVTAVVPEPTAANTAVVAGFVMLFAAAWPRAHSTERGLPCGIIPSDESYWSFEVQDISSGLNSMALCQASRLEY